MDLDLNRRKELTGISKEALHLALQQVKEDAPLTEFDLELVNNDDLQDAAIVFMKNYFVPFEPLVQAFGVEWDKDAEGYWREVFKQGMSLVLLTKNRDIVAIRGIEIVNKTDTIVTEDVTDKRLRDLLEYIKYCDAHAQFFERYGCEEAIHFSGLAVHDEYKRKGLATYMMRTAVDFVKQLRLESVYVKGEASSNFSKRIYEKLGFDLLFEQSYEDYRVNGQCVMHNIKEHKSNKVYGKLIKLETSGNDVHGIYSA